MRDPIFALQAAMRAATDEMEAIRCSLQTAAELTQAHRVSLVDLRDEQCIVRAETGFALVEPITSEDEIQRFRDVLAEGQVHMRTQPVTPVEHQLRSVGLSAAIIAPIRSPRGFCGTLNAAFPEPPGEQAQQVIGDVARTLQQELTRRQTRAPLHILVVDDNPINLMVLEGLLSHLGHQVKTVSSGESAIEQCGASWFDIIFLDLRMPGLDGPATAQHLRQTLSPCPVIVAVTASPDSEQRNRCRRIGMEGYMTKPVLLDELQRTIAHMFPGTGA